MESPARGRCPYCLGALQETPEAGGVVRCARCKTPHHGACFEEHTGCTIYGCGSREALGLESTAPIVAVSAVSSKAALHPFLPLLQVERPGRFLAVERPERIVEPGRRRPKGRVLRLQLPTRVGADGRVTGSLEAIVPAAVLGQGLRLRVEAWLDGDEAPVLVGREEAVLVGRAGRGWLERLNLWSRPETALLASGRTRVRFAFDAAPWAWTGPLPAGTRWGPRLRLRVSALLDATPATSTRLHTIEVRSRRGSLEALPDRALRGPPADLPLWPSLPGEGWCARPLVVPAGDEVRPVGAFAVRRADAEADTPPGLVVTATASTAGLPRVSGTVSLTLKRNHRGLGPLVLTCLGERRVGDRPWERVSGERALVCGPPRPDAACAGRHVFDFEYAPPWPERAPAEDEARRVRFRATMKRSGGGELKSAGIAVVLRRRRRPVTGEAT